MPDRSGDAPVVVVGAGIAGLVAAAVLAHAGRRVTLLDRAKGVGGKLHVIDAGGLAVDAGPTVFTLKPWFEDLFAQLGEDLNAHVRTRPLSVLARHAWSDGARLDLLPDVQASADAIAAFAGPDEAQRYRVFCDRSERIFRALEAIHMRAQRPTPASLAWRALHGQGWRGLRELTTIAPFARLADELARQFRNPRLRQLFGRYATYCGASPYAAPATLMLVAHAERAGVWSVEGGMQGLAQAFAELALARGATLRCGADVVRLEVVGGRIRGVELRGGERLAAEHVIWAGDVAALASGMAGHEARRAVPTDAGRAQRSLSALTWTGLAEARCFELARHNVFFSDDGASEFEDLFGAGRLPRRPTVYVCAQDRDAPGASASAAERIFWLANAPATADATGLTEMEIERCERATLNHLRRCGLHLRWLRATVTRSTPSDFDRRFPGSGGALYGRATHGWQASFRRPGAASRIPGLWLAGGSVHPGPGLPMAATSGWLAAQGVLAAPAFRTSIFRSTMVGTPGGTSMR